MIAAPRLTRIAGVFAVGLAALVAGTAQASAGCSLESFATSGTTLTIFTDSDPSGVTSVTLTSGSFSSTVTALTVTTSTITLTIPDEPVPTVTSVNFGSDHAVGSTSGGSSLTINGSNFLPTMNVTITGGNCDTASGTFLYGDVTAVDVGGTQATITFISMDSAITIATPPGIAGIADIVVFTTHENSGATGSKRFAYLQGGPTVSGVDPNLGLTTIATPVTVSGSNFIAGTFHDGTAATTVSFPCNGTTLTPQGTATVASGGSLSVTTPTCSLAGAVNVTVTTPLGSASGQYQYVAPGQPHVTGLSPNTGNILGGTVVTISGSNFIGATTVTFGTVATTGFTVISAGQISLPTPPQSAAGPVNVTVTVNNGTTNLTSTDTATFTYTLPPPVVNTISPSSGSTAGGTTVHIYGQYFTGTSCPSGVTFGGTTVTSCTLVSDTQIDAVTAPHTPGTGLNVVVTTPSGMGTGANLYTYGTPAPTVSSVAPTTGGVGGGQTVTITGTNFTGATSVTFGGAAATGISVNSDTQITATTPPHSAGTVDVAVTTAAGTGIGSSLYTYSSSPPTVTGISPASGSTLGGTQVTITGTNFNGTPQVKIGGVAAAQVTVVSSTIITAVTPAGSGAVQVQVTTSFGTSTANPPGSTYTYAAPVTPPPPPPTVTGVSPTFGTTLGLTPVTITGTSLTGATAVTFGGKPATNVVVVDDQHITALTPPGALGAVDVAVTTLGGTGTKTGAYTYVTAAPTVTGASPNTGTSQGGTTVTITGNNFTGTTAVTFGGVAVTNFTVLTATTIVATTPPGTAGPAVDIAVMTASGTGTGAKLFTYLTQPPPTVTAINPNSGNTAGGTQVQITGTNFSGATSVTIGGNPATFVTVVSPTQINATTPAHAVPGAVDVVVTTAAGIGTGTKLYTYVASAPTVTGIAPTNGPIAGGTAVTITGTNFTGATSILIGGIAPTAVTVVSPTSITATTPAHAAGAVSVAVTTPVGTGTGTNLFTYTAPVSVLPTVTAVSPSRGPPGGGTSVTITGTNFTNATAVMFGGTNAAFFTVVSATSITARSPAGSGTVDVTVITAAGTSATGASDQFSYAKATTSLTLTSSPNPSNTGQAVTFTVKVTGDSPTGTVTFSENGQAIGTAMLVSGVATFTISTLPAGSNAVTASYSGDANNAPDPETVVQVVNATSDSVRLRQMQMAVMPVVTNMSGQAISGAIDNAISAGFGGGCQLVMPNGGGFTYCFDGDAPAQSNPKMDESNLMLDERQRLESDLAALGFADDPAATKKAPTAPPPPRDWLAWIDVRGTDFNRTTLGSDIKGTQVNGTAGITRRLTPDFLVGVLGGYEHFDFTSQAYSGALKGDGFTAGAYIGWRLASTLRFDASGAWSDITADDSAGTASGNFTGHRWFASAGVTGTYAWQATVFEPSARVYTLWEQENAYTDSLGTLQASHTFDTGRGSAGLKVSHNFPAGFGTLAPYVGLYGDYYFSKDDATTTPGLTAVPLLQGGAARATGGVTMMFGGGAQLSVGGEYSGLGQDTRIWNLKLHGSVPF